jgi:phage terminase large subunit-like protein
MHHSERCTEIGDMKELKIMQCIEGSAEGSKNSATLKGLNISGFNTAKTWDIV